VIFIWALVAVAIAFHAWIVPWNSSRLFSSKNTVGDSPRKAKAATILLVNDEIG
jgi:hypothetical protein